MYVPVGGEENRLWIASKDGSFSASPRSFWPYLKEQKKKKRNVVNKIWKIKAPPRVEIFGWLVLWNRILTMDNLRRRGRIEVNGCLMCLSDEGLVDHLMLNCKIA